LEQSHITSEWEFCGQAVLNNPDSGIYGVAKGKFVVPVKVHNTIKLGDELEIIPPGYDIIKMKLKSMVDIETGEKIEEAHGGLGKVIGLICPKYVPEYSVVRRKKLLTKK
jgi:hypothetical protein